jgi:hypothetical protein
MWIYVQEITRYLVTLALVSFYLAYINSKFEVIAVSILLLIYAHLYNRTLWLAAKADIFMSSIVDSINRIRQGIHDEAYDSKGEACGMAKIEKAVNKIKIQVRIDDAIFFILLLIVAMKLFVTLF